MEDKIICPLIDKLIDEIECIENIDCINGIQKETSIPKKYKEKKNWKELCKKCKYNNIDKKI